MIVLESSGNQTKRQKDVYGGYSDCNYDNDYYGDQMCRKTHQPVDISVLAERESILGKLFFYSFMH